MLNAEQLLSFDSQYGINLTTELTTEQAISNVGYSLLAHTIFCNDDNDISKWEEIRNQFNFLNNIYN